MILIDANLLLYSYDPTSVAHRQTRRWLEELFSSGKPVRLAWVSILAFLRIGTDPRVLRTPFSMEEATNVVGSWLDLPSVAVLEAGDRHWQIWSDLLRKGQIRSRMATDAHLAALAIEHGATLCTTDRDFARFPGLKTLDPLER